MLAVVRRHAAVAVGAAVVATIGIGLVVAIWPSAAERHVRRVTTVEGYRRTSIERPNELTAVSYWVGPTNQDPLSIISFQGVTWRPDAEGLPPSYITSNWEGLLGGYMEIASANIDGQRCSSFVDQLNVAYWRQPNRQFGGRGATAEEISQIMSGEFALLAIGVTCY